MAARGVPAFIRGLPRAADALVYARRAHAGQERSFDGAPFIEHPIEVASILHQAGAADDLVAAGILHDTIEKTGVTAGHLRDRFGNRIAGLVAAVTEDASIAGFADRKQALRDQVAAAGRDAVLLSLADKISKVRELRLALLADPAALRQRVSPGSRARRMRHYDEFLRTAEDLLPDEPLVARLRAELELTPGSRVAAART
jgi:(p)ppGpp synthase/HD superfamily hydrolase